MIADRRSQTNDGLDVVFCEEDTDERTVVMQMALSGTVAGDFYFATYALIGMKLLATIAQFVWMRGSYRDVPQGVLFRMIYVTGKGGACFGCNLRMCVLGAATECGA